MLMEKVPETTDIVMFPFLSTFIVSFLDRKENPGFNGSLTLMGLHNVDCWCCPCDDPSTGAITSSPAPPLRRVWSSSPFTIPDQLRRSRLRRLAAVHGCDLEL